MAGRDREDTKEALETISGAFHDDHHKPPIIKRMLSFQVFTSTLLLIVVVLSGVSLFLALENAEEARLRAEARTQIFEDQIEVVLERIEETQDSADQQRDEIQNLLELIESHLETS